MRHPVTSISFAFLSLALAMPALANTVPIPANPPASKCVTASTTASHEAYQAQLEKDVAPYAKSAPAAVKAYREALHMAWEAMLQPYCGAGQYGITPFVHSYSKSVDRERATFLAAVKTSAQGKVVAATLTTPAPQPVVIPKKKIILSIPTGLHRGMRSEDVKMLQAFLAAHFKLAYDDLATGYFGPLTEKYLIKYQLETGVIAKTTTPGAGLFGPKTAHLINGN